MTDFPALRTVAPPARAQRAHGAELVRIDHQVEKAEAQVEGINRVAQRALFDTMMTGLVRRQAEQMAPDQAEVLAMISIAAGVGSVQVINNMYRR